MQGLVRTSELARILSVDPKTIRLWADSGKIPVALWTGKTIRFNICAVKQVLDALTAAALKEKQERRQAAKAANAAQLTTASDTNG